MKFKTSQIVQHKITKEKYVITKCFKKTWYRIYPYYECSDGKKSSYYSNTQKYNIYENELEKKNEKKL